MTYVESVISLVLKGDSRKNLSRLRYYNSIEDEIHRKHFVSADWLPHNQSLGFIEDITFNVFPDSKVASSDISKSEWFSKSKEKEVSMGFNRSSLKKSVTAEIPYIPIESLIKYSTEIRKLKKMGLKLNIKSISMRLNDSIFSRIPDGAIVSMIHRDPEKYRNKIGSNILVGHIGFIIRKKNVLYLRHADRPRKILMDLPLTVFLNSVKKTFKGFNVSVVKN